MSRLEELIAELCPDGVEYKPLEEISEYCKTRIDAKLVNADTYIGVDNLLPDKQGKKKSDYVPSDGQVIAFNENDILIGNIRPYLKKIWRADSAGGTNGDVLAIHIIDNNMTSEFLYYILSSNDFFIYDNQHAKGAKMPRGNKDAVMKYRVPVPPLPVQREIVRILDNFTELTAELTAELLARKKQYEYYRDLLLTFNDTEDIVSRQTDITEFLSFINGFVFVTIGEICSISRGKVISKDYIHENPGIYPVYSSQTENDGMLGMISTYEYDGEYITWTTDGANAGTIFYRKGCFNITNVCGLLKPLSPSINIRYLYHVLSATAKKYVNSGMGNPKLMSNVMASIRVPIPTPKEQERIATILDRFDALCNDLTSGLPAEIEARRKQYEYYRDKLLTFKERS